MMSSASTLTPVLPVDARAPAVAGRRKRPRLAASLVVAEGMMESAALVEIAGGTAAIFSTRSPHKATPNEDVAAVLPVSPGHGVLAVADGLGGHAGGERASRLAVKTIQQTIHVATELSEDPDQVDPLRPAILDGIEAANEQVRGIGTGAATTLVLVEIRDRVLRSYHVGDSAILLVGQRGKLKFQTIAHSPIGYAVEAGLIDEKDAIHHAERHVISNVIGSPEMRIEIGPAIEMAARDTLVLASDGLLDNLLSAEIVELVRTGPLDEAVDKLVAVATERMNAPDRATPSKPDDLTVIAFRPC
ncbi:MAG TPA: protein phosphatase 2C domain-containing protein [Lacipirellulaceae bacterium]